MLFNLLLCIVVLINIIGLGCFLCLMYIGMFMLVVVYSGGIFKLILMVLLGVIDCFLIINVFVVI